MKWFLILVTAMLLDMRLPAYAASPPSGSGSGSPTLDAVRARGRVLCGVAGTVAGFSLADSQGEMRGIDADGCRAVAAAIFGDPARAQFVRVTTQGRFTALQSGEIDVLFRGTTWTLAREASLGLLVGVPYFYDGTGFLVRTAARIATARDLNGATLCMQPGTSTELAVSDWFRQRDLTFKVVEIDDLGQLESAFLAGRCDAFSTDSSALAGFRAAQASHAGDFTLLPDLASKEPLGPLVRKGDDKWFDLIRWIAFAQMTAEEEGVSSRTVDQLRAASPSPVVRRLLGVTDDVGPTLGVDALWAYHVIKSVGNSQEMWDRNLAPLGIPRGLNRLWSQGGLNYPPPLR